MHLNEKLLQQMFASLNRHEYRAIAECYHSDATFHDIAFDLKGRKEIGEMWQMICNGDIRATFEVVHANDRDALVKLVDEYTFSDTGRKVRNQIESRFQFRGGLISEHRDFCDARLWADAALGGVKGFLAGRLRFLRSWKARSKLQRFIRENA